MKLVVPQKVSWWMDLTESGERRFAKKAWHKLQMVEKEYADAVVQQELPSSMISQLFVPIYERNVMSKQDYRLDKAKFFASVEKMNGDPSYKLIWFSLKQTGKGLGGNVVHLYSDRVMTAYRSYDHALAMQLGMRYFDYYADYQLQEYVKRLGVAVLGRGKMGHPCKSLGLSMFKIRTGAVVRVAKDESVWELGEEEMRTWLERWGMLAWYGEPDSEGRYTELNVRTNLVSGEFERELQKTFGRVGVEVRIGQI